MRLHPVARSGCCVALGEFFYPNFFPLLTPGAEEVCVKFSVSSCCMDIQRFGSGARARVRGWRCRAQRRCRCALNWGPGWKNLLELPGSQSLHGCAALGDGRATLAVAGAASGGLVVKIVERMTGRLWRFPILKRPAGGWPWKCRGMKG